LSEVAVAEMVERTAAVMVAAKGEVGEEAAVAAATEAVATVAEMEEVAMATAVKAEGAASEAALPVQ